MTNRLIAYWLFFPLGILFLLLNHNLESSTLMCVYYAFFVGTVWTLIPQLAKAETLAWTHLIPPFLLVMLMMLGTRMQMMISTETVVITAMALIHFRACILAFARMPNQLRAFKWIQFLLFIFALSYLFQSRVLPFPVSRPNFLMIMIVAGVSSVGLLFQFNRAQKRVASV